MMMMMMMILMMMLAAQQGEHQHPVSAWDRRADDLFWPKDPFLHQERVSPDDYDYEYDYDDDDDDYDDDDGDDSNRYKMQIEIQMQGVSWPGLDKDQKKVF